MVFLIQVTSHNVLFLNLGDGYMGVFMELHMEGTRRDTFPFGLGLTDPHPQGGQPERGMETRLRVRAGFWVEGAGRSPHSSPQSGQAE